MDLFCAVNGGLWDKNVTMWWRFLTFCVLVCFILFVVLSCIHGRPVTHLLFHRCCEENIENDQAIFENYGNNFLRERLIGSHDIVVDNDDSFVSSEEVEELISVMREKINVHDPKSRINVTFIETLPKEETRELVRSEEVTTELGTVLNSTSTKLTSPDIFPASERREFSEKEDDTTKIEVGHDQKTRMNTFTNILTIEEKEELLEQVISSNEEVDTVREISEEKNPVTETKSEMVPLKKEMVSELDAEESLEVTTKNTDEKVTMLYSSIIK